jgi:galactokinase
MGPSAEPAAVNREGDGPDAAGLGRSVKSAFLEIFGYPSRRLFPAPGRVNLIGEHTDYNDGFVLPMAIDRSVWMAAAPADRRDRTVRLVVLSLDSAEHAISLDGLQPEPVALWANYVRGVLALLERAGHRLGSLDLAYPATCPLARA